MVFILYLHRKKNDETSKLEPMYFLMTLSTYINFSMISLAVLGFLFIFAFKFEQY